MVQGCACLNATKGHTAFFLAEKNWQAAGKCVGHVHITFFYGRKSAGSSEHFINKALCVGFVSMASVFWKHITVNHHMFACLKRNDNMIS